MTVVLGLVGVAFLVAGGWMVWWNLSCPELRWDWDRCDVDETRFPKEILWGVATAAHQVEGGCDNNNWSHWEKQTNARGQPRIKNDDKAGMACDHWNRYSQDIRLMKELGVKAYRFSVEWSKLEPRRGEFDDAAFAHYLDLCDALFEAGISPVVTLHHFTHPLWFHESGAFEKRENIEPFARFCEEVFGRLRSRVKMWCTINEPAVFATQGYFTGLFPPGRKDLQQTGEVLVNLLEAHAVVYRRLKALPGGAEARIGLAKSIFQFEPWRRASLLDWMVTGAVNRLFNDCLLDGLRTGKFRLHIPGLVRVKRSLPDARGSLDFVGLNYYSHLHARVRLDPKEPFELRYRQGDTMTDMPYVIYPEGFYRALHQVATLGVPIYVTENGIADAKDDRRALFIRRYLYAMHRAILAGCDIQGYFYWSLMDNFEWSEGYSMRFGLYEVDFKTQERRLREGAKPFLQAIRGGSLQST